MSDSTACICVIMPVYNVAAHVAAAVESLRAQTHTQFKAVVVDDGSTDGSGAIARQAAEGDARFVFITRENGGLSAARNTGLEAISGEFVTFLDSDDRYAPSYLETLLQALEADGADWAACAIRYVQEDGSGATHSAIHGRAELSDHKTQRHSLTDWRDVIGHFPSAWNKIYRRSLIEGLRFDEGTWFEDHAWFYRIACRTDHILHVPAPLYLQTQGRAGQITRDGGERVFEQFAVLDTMRGIIDGADKPGGGVAFERIATRLVYERSTQVSEPARRARYIARTRAYFGENSLNYSPEWDPGIGRAFGLVLAGEVPVSVVIPVDPETEPQALVDTRDSLAQQRLRDFEVIEQMGAAPADENRNQGLLQAKGRFVVFLDAGDRLAPWALSAWVEGMMRQSAAMGASRFVMGLSGGTPHSGLHGPAPEVEGPTLLQDQALDLHAHPSAKIFDRAFLKAKGLRFAPGPLSAWDLTLRAAQAAEAVLYFPTPGARIATRPATRRLWRSAPSFEVLEQALAALPVTDNPRRLFARALWEKLNYAVFETESDKAAFRKAAATHAKAMGFDAGSAPLDPYIGPQIRAILGLPQDPR